MANLKKAAIFIILWTFVALTDSSVAIEKTESRLKNGEYLFRVSGGCSCHTVPDNSDEKMAGGRGLKTPFGAIYSTNITPDNTNGIGTWTAEDFSNAMTQGIRADGAHLFPVFPYTSFTQIRKDDLDDLYAYLQSFPGVNKENRDDELFFLFKPRIGLFFWKLLNFNAGEFKPNPNKGDQWNRGAYLVEALAHCKECHSPRNLTGGLKPGHYYSGSSQSPEGGSVPDITSDPESGIGDWEKDAISWFLQTGQKPDGDYVGGLMAEVIDQGYRFLTPQDLDAMILFISEIPPAKN
jgi:mono/diheme cytochrome c family protein